MSDELVKITKKGIDVMKDNEQFEEVQEIAQHAIDAMMEKEQKITLRLPDGLQKVVGTRRAIK